MYIDSQNVAWFTWIYKGVTKRAYWDERNRQLVVTTKEKQQ